jgi:HEAT repeat protein
MRQRAEELTERIVGLLEADRVELRCAAAMVLGAAGRGKAEIGKALAKKLDDPSPMMRRFVLDALEEMGARGLSSVLVPLLGSGDEEIKQKALRLLAAQGAHAEGALVRELASGTPAQKRAAASMLMKARTAAALDALLEALGDEHVGEHVLQLLRAEIDRGDQELRQLLHKRSAAGARTLAKKGKGRGPEDPIHRQLGVLLRVLGYLGEPAHRPVLVEYAQ